MMNLKELSLKLFSMRILSVSMHTSSKLQVVIEKSLFLQQKVQLLGLTKKVSFQKAMMHLASYLLVLTNSVL